MKWKFWKSAIVVALIVIVIIPAGSLVIWTAGTLGPSEHALLMLQSDSEVRITQESHFITFEPVESQPYSGFILYPGARVDFRSYSPLLRQIAARNHLVVVLHSPLNIAFFNANGADEVMAAYPHIKNWVIGGHSLGGVVAASYVSRRPSVSGLVLWASYPADDSLGGTNVKVLSIYGANDKLTTPADVFQSQDLLPPDATFVEIRGGNHSQFGSYGQQPGDGKATITTEEQWTQIIDATVELLELDAK
jgi:pimeloyl-ACP methyl ester carboxylesterase